METENLESIIQKATGIRITRTEDIYSNEVFTTLCERVKNHVKRRRELQSVLHIHIGEMNSIIQRPRENVLKKQESLDFLFCDGSVIRFSSYGEMELELTRVKVPAENRGKGTRAWHTACLQRRIEDPSPRAWHTAKALKAEGERGPCFSGPRRIREIKAQFDFI